MIADRTDVRHRRHVLGFQRVTTPRFRVVFPETVSVCEIRVYDEPQRLVEIARRAAANMAMPDAVPKLRWLIDVDPEELPGIVLDASQGQNALVQAEKFNEALGLTGITVTKLDGSAKGGILIAIADRLKIPVRFIGIGESAEDMQPLSAEDSVDVLLSSGQQAG